MVGDQDEATEHSLAGNSHSGASSLVAVRVLNSNLAPKVGMVTSCLVPDVDPFDPCSVAELEAHTVRLVQLIARAREDGDAALIQSLRQELLVVRQKVIRVRRQADVSGTRPGISDPPLGG